MMEKTKIESGFSSDAKKDPRRIVFITRNTSAKVKDEREPRVMTYPHLLVREAVVFEALIIAMVLLALFWDAPLEQLANPLLTPNPAKAPWYFLGLQELLHFFPPLVAGILIPTLVVIALIVIPYFNINVEGKPLWSEHPSTRFGIVRIVNLAGSSPRFTSCHLSGVDTVAPGCGRTEYGAARVCPRLFCKKSRYTRPCRWAGLRTTLVEPGSAWCTTLDRISAN